ncbi:hypothetical protein AJ79_04445 [Helicocarpus griseus UAMH5409]|uniref:Myb-like domain-containing protein n=1 Tax=Helicocarpus griseus UAMH5409 TaxID=1447875 RepID=A0A2B7XTQ3_9EURO|nr:hypothetical protein AJ79_04445 [Helicocarpus griseus UAMH5409]
MADPFAGTGAVPTVPDDSAGQLRDLPQLSSNLRIAPLRDPIPSRSLRVPSPLEPNAGGIRESNNISKNSFFGGNPPSELPTLEDFLNAARTSDSPFHSISGKVSSSSGPPPRTILPTFINLRAIEKLPYPSFDEEVPRKRRRLDVNGDVFGEHLQLPIPKNQKKNPKRPPFGPLTILNGLNEPPPNAALFPPIEPNASPTILTRPTRDPPGPCDVPSTSSTKEQRGKRINDIIEPSIEEADEPVVDNREDSVSLERAASKETTEESDKEPASAKCQKQPRKKLRKWTEEETKDLLRGVVKCGVGNWKAILSQPELKFNQRTAGNLKDRFRVCCPWAYGSDQKTIEAVKTSLTEASNGPELHAAGKLLLPDPKASNNTEEPNSNSTATASNHSSQNIIVDLSPPDTPSASTDGPPSTTSSSTKSKTKNSQSSTSGGGSTLSNKSKSTLMSLGLQEPCLSVKSSRRSRRPFTPAEDEALLRGYAIHGFQWTLIWQDKDLNLMHRKATDLRDRFRTKFPDVYREAGSVTAKDIKNGKKNIISNDPVNEASTHRDQGAVAAIAREPKNQSKAPEHSDTADSVSGRKNTSQSPSIDPNNTNQPEPITLPPLPPSGLPDLPSLTHTSIFPFLMDDAGPGGLDTWGDNTLPPLWDDLT